MPGCPIFSCFPRYKAYTQINAMGWDMRGDHSPQERRSSRRRYPPHNSPMYAPQMKQAYPTPFTPHSFPTAPPPKRSTLKSSRASYHTFPRSAVPPQFIPGTHHPPYPPGPPQISTIQPFPINTPSRHHSSHRQHSQGYRPQSRSVSAATSRHVHYADSTSRPRSRQTSAQSSYPFDRGVPVTTSRPAYSAVAQQPTQGRRRSHSAGSASRLVVMNPSPSNPLMLQPRVTSGHKYSRCTGRKKALCIGINYTGQKRELRGCINDIKNIKRFLTRQWGFKDGDIVMLMDQTTNPRQMPTRRNIIEAMKWLVKDAKSHDSLFFHYSGHGGQIPDTHGDELSGFDEVIYPVDYKAAGVIVDDIYRSWYVRHILLPEDATGSPIWQYHHDGRLKDPTSTARAQLQNTSQADVISFAACRDDQTSADTVQGGVAVGAMSYAFITALTRKPAQSYLELLQSIRDIVQPHFTQKAQLSSGHYIDTHLRFIL
ncbi:hypothetical protein JVU11DRAFT_9656 [Chiua virens]|nr:hypothetical protein JVU11DRAFT_9656 [Chiua virens]